VELPHAPQESHTFFHLPDARQQAIMHPVRMFSITGQFHLQGVILKRRAKDKQASAEAAFDRSRP